MTETRPRSVVIVGTGIAGVRTAESLRSEGFDGDLLMVGAESVAPYDRPPLSKQVLAGEWPIERTELLDDSRVGTLGVRIIPGCRATQLRAGAITTDSAGTLPFDALVIATGVRPRLMPQVSGLPGVHMLRTQQDCLALRDDLEAAESLLVIGGGFIGAEVASTVRAMDKAVTVIEPQPVLLGRVLSAPVGALCEAMHREHGVDVRTAMSVHSVTTDRGRLVARLADSSEVRADCALVGIGSTPNTEWLAGTGLDLSDGVRCDPHGRVVGWPDVYAVGDVAAWFDPAGGTYHRDEHWTSATEQAASVGRLIATGTERQDVVTPYFWSDQYGIKIQVFGRPGLQTSVEFLAMPADGVRGTFAAYEHGGIVVATVGFGAMKAAIRSKPLVERGASLDEVRLVFN